MANSTNDTLSPKTDRPRVVVIGAGFGGLNVVRRLARSPFEVLLIDRNNYHGFWPLLYQVATAGLEAQQIAYPVRGILRRRSNLHLRIATVEGVDVDRQEVLTDLGSLPYDELVVAPGTVNNFFGLKGVEAHAFGFKEIADALAVRNHILMSFERAAVEPDPERVRELLTFVVVGGGPTGVELSGAIAELVRHVMRKDYPTIDISNVQIILLEMLDRLLPPFPPALGRRAERKLVKLGVDVRLGASVTDYQNDSLELKDGTAIKTRTVIWAAGVRGNPLGESLGVPLQRGGRVPVTPELHLPGRSNVWVIGDLAYLEDPAGKPYPQVASVAIQQAGFVAENLQRKRRNEPLRPFRYLDKGSMATVGRNYAVARIWGINWSGYIAWVLWLGVHLLYLVGVRNRLLVLVNWIYNYLTYDRAARAIIMATPHPASEEVSAAMAAPEAAR